MALVRMPHAMGTSVMPSFKPLELESGARGEGNGVAAECDRKNPSPYAPEDEVDGEMRAAGAAEGRRLGLRASAGELRGDEVVVGLRELDVVRCGGCQRGCAMRYVAPPPR